MQVRKDETQHEQFEARVAGAAMGLSDELGIDPEIADKLFRAGGASADLVTQMPVEYLTEALDGDSETAAVILQKAIDKTSGSGSTASSNPSNDDSSESADSEAAAE